MFSIDLPNLFSRDFVIGYFLPAVLFISASFGLVAGFDLLPVLPNLFPSAQASVLSSIAVIGLASILLGIFLLIANQDITSLMEGDWPFGLARFFSGKEKKRYRQLDCEIKQLDEARQPYLDKEEEVPADIRSKRNRLKLQMVDEFPDTEEFVLPTRFGNTVRAFEVYPRVMYGFEGQTRGWNRLIGVMPQEYRDLVDAAKAKTDFWVNLWLLSILMIFGYLAVVAYVRQIEVLWLPIAALMLAFFAARSAKKTAVEWGNLVRASFDIFLPELFSKVGFKTSGDGQREREIWTKFSQAVIYRSPATMPDRNELQQGEEQKVDGIIDQVRVWGGYKSHSDSERNASRLIDQIRAWEGYKS